MYLNFIEEINANPKDEAIRLIFADKLDEDGESTLAEFVRLDVAASRKDCSREMVEKYVKIKTILQRLCHRQTMTGKSYQRKGVCEMCDGKYIDVEYVVATGSYFKVECERCGFKTTEASPWYNTPREDIERMRKLGVSINEQHRVGLFATSGSGIIPLLPHSETPAPSGQLVNNRFIDGNYTEREL